MNFQKSPPTDQQENVTDKKTRYKMAEQLAKKTHFSRQEIEGLLTNFRGQSARSISGQPAMDRTTFRDFVKLFDITDDIIMDRVFKAFDTDNDTFISMEEWIKGLSIFLRGTIAERTKFCFYVYDMGGDGFIGRDDMFHLLKNCIVKNITDEDQEEPVRELVEYCLKLLDTDRDQRVSPNDFFAAVQNDNLLLELLGTCLPSPRRGDEFQLLCICH